MAMHLEKRLWYIAPVAVFIFLFLIGVAPLFSQQSVSQLIITGSDDSSAPTVQLHVYALDNQGNSISLDEQSVVVKHNGLEVSDVSLANPYEAGTFALIVLDVPGGVAAHIPVIQEAILEFASDSYMKQQVDYVAIYAVDELAASQIIEPVEFHNSIANVFASPLSPKSGATALIDSLMGLLNNLDSLKPNEDMTIHIVVMSDGTDIVSTQFEASEVPKKASELGIPIHTVILDNQSLSSNDKEIGRSYMIQIAAGTRAISTTLATADDLRPIWDRITSFRDQTTLQYTVENAAGGDYLVNVSLRDNPAVEAETTVTFPPGAPSVILDLPPENRSLTLPNLDQPTALTLAATVSWLDGAEREVTKAQLLVNGLVVQDIDVNDLEQFEVGINNLQYGPNQIQVAIVDDQGGRAISPEITLTIEEGETNIPEAVAPRSLPERIWQRVSGAAVFVGGCFLVVFLLVLIVGITIAGRRSSLVQRLGLVSLLRRIPFLRSYVQDASRAQRYVRQADRVGKQARRYSSDVQGGRQSAKSGARPSPFLEVIESTTAMPSRLDLDDVELHLGRSAAQSDIVFKDDPTVSRMHATIAREGNDSRIFDEQSTSGTWVNEQRVPDYGLQLMDGDEIRLGAVRLRFRQP